MITRQRSPNRETLLGDHNGLLDAVPILGMHRVIGRQTQHALEEQRVLCESLHDLRGYQPQTKCDD